MLQSRQATLQSLTANRVPPRPAALYSQTLSPSFRHSIGNCSFSRALCRLAQTVGEGGMNKSDWVRPSCRVVLICLAIAALGAQSVAAEPATAPHGAMPMPAQQQRLDQLITGLTTPPPGIDPVAWATIYVPAGNEATAERIALGRKLYFDTRLSKDGTLSK